MRSKKKWGLVITLAMVMLVSTACNSKGASNTDSANPAAGEGSTPASAKTITLGFSQVGAESGWRSANTKSIQDSAKEAGYDLKFSDAQQKQENQIKALRSFIQQKVTVIAFSPVVESGWDTVLKEAKDAGIPVILTDRAVDSPDKSLYKTFIGSDFVEEGRKAGQWLADQYKDTQEDVNIVELQGTTGSAPANDRQEGFMEIIGSNAKLKVIASQTGDFTRAKGKEVMQAFLKAHKKIDVLYAHNDDMALGAIQAIEAAGLKPGVDIKIISVDAVKDGMQAAADGKINFIVECNPLLGPQLMEAVQAVVDGKEIEARIVTDETTFTSDQAKEALPTREY
ncbi:ABC transporter substrate-binding protein [Paenibacillus barcinonensis]|uniref:ABC transporter substrate-binding protein n=1 Tax=Paenibacillus barcinonensis TaxID=198119 RepID=A0A2V4WEH8_PAEBA|nr:ABC transporter substrate-binding protein [Paenibacillus barcinonensis]PYE50074.1 simple sugar transport system substrate-binding protein [Paenibacillus barcinonensis]QKS59815.1 ABC transporter substrate-binding protein [Paenibacillus barcinonensis]